MIYRDFLPPGRLPWRTRLRLLFARKVVGRDPVTGYAIVVKVLDGRWYVVDERRPT